MKYAKDILQFTQKDDFVKFSITYTKIITYFVPVKIVSGVKISREENIVKNTLIL